jgi:hypothetical protein
MKGPETATISNRTSTSHPGSPQGPGLRWGTRLRSGAGSDSGVHGRVDDSAGGAVGAIQAAVVLLAEPAGPWCPRGLAHRPKASRPPAEQVAAATSTAVRKPVPSCASVTAISGGSPSKARVCVGRGGLGCHRLRRWRKGDQGDQRSVF